MSLKFRGHVFADARAACECCVGDARRVISDPTGTQALRRKYNGTMQLRWRSLRVAVRTMIVDKDFLALKSGGLFQPVQAAVIAGGSKTLAFQRWLDWALNQVVLGGDGSVMRPFLSQAYGDGVTYAQAQTNKNVFANVASHRLELLSTLATVELQGIMEAVSQQSVRAIANALLQSSNQMTIVRAVWSIIDKVGVVRTRAMTDLMTVKAFNEGVLDTFEAAKVRAVGLVAESAPKARNFGDARPARGPGSRSSRKRTPSRSTIARIVKAELAVQALGRVNVRTAGDDDVCEICEGIADDGPYSINRARALIPAHPHCRCTFVPVDDARFAIDGASLGRVDVPTPLGRAPSHDQGVLLDRSRAQGPDFKKLLKAHAPLKDYNECHEPSGSSAGGQFSSACSAGGGSEKPNMPNPLGDDDYDNLSPNWSQRMDPERRKIMEKATVNWTGVGYEKVNDELRSGRDWAVGKEQRNIRGLDRAFEVLGKDLPRDTTLFRGVRMDSSESEKRFAVGNVIEDKGFNSTTPDIGIAHDFSGGFQLNRGVIMHIRAKKGTRVYIPLVEEGEGSMGAEREVLLNRGTRYQVVHRAGQNVYVDVIK